MTLRDAIDQYITWRRAHGAEFRAQTYLLKLFLKSVDGQSFDTPHEVVQRVFGKCSHTSERLN